jgi:uncharacterized protein DUF5666
MPVSMRNIPRPAIGGAAAVLLTLFLAGCDHTATSPRSSLPAQFSTTISLPDFQSHLLSGTTRVEVHVIPGTLTARRVEIEEPEQLTRPEEIRGRVTAITAGTDTATLTLELGGVQVAVNGSTRLLPDEEDADPAAMTLAGFVARIQADLAAGGSPAVRASRQPPAQPQAPGDGGFLAAELKLDEGNNHSFIKMNVTSAALVSNATPPPDAWLKLLGLTIELRISDGTTRLALENPDLEGVREFEGIVQSVDMTAQTVTLKDGTIIRIVAGTEIEAREGDEDDHLTSLADVQAALTAGKTVKTEGKGLLDSATPLTIDAIRIEFEVEGEPLPPPVMMIAFADSVTAVDVAASTFTLKSGAVVRVLAETFLDADGNLQTLQAVSDALAAHHGVFAEGVATVDAAGPPPQLTAHAVKFESS